MQLHPRTSITVVLTALAALWIGTHSGVTAAGGDMATAKSLYASASYEEALAQLNSIERVDDPEQVEQYKALCLLALGRSGDAEHALERIVTTRPLFRMEGVDVSPKLATMFHDVRRRMLPTAARELYTKAKSSFERKDYAAAADRFKELLEVVADAKGTGDATSLNDLKELGEGFLRLTQAQLAAAAEASAIPNAQASAPANVPPTPVAAVKTIYTLGEEGVIAPVSVSTPFPRWAPSGSQTAQRTFKGIIEVVIDERGAVESVALRDSISPMYDSELLSMAKRWRFVPAMKGGKPVRFMKVLEVVLKPQST